MIRPRLLIAVLCATWLGTMGLCLYAVEVWSAMERYEQFLEDGTPGTRDPVHLVAAPEGDSDPATLSTLAASERNHERGEKSRWRTFEATGYSHGCIMPRSGIEGPPRRGADGEWPVANLTVAADPSIPFGTVVEISHEGIVSRRVVGDRGRAIRGRKLDLFVEDCERAREWGRQSVMVRILEDVEAGS